MVGLNILPFTQNPRRYWTSGLTVAVHVSLHALAWAAGGWGTWAVAVAVPYTLLAAVGSNLSYAQHNYPGPSGDPTRSGAMSTRR